MIKNFLHAGAFLTTLFFFSCKVKSDRVDVVKFFPSDKEELYSYGFENGTGELSSNYYWMEIRDTVLRFFYPNENYQVKQILFNLNKFDSAQLYEWFKTVDPDFEISSQMIRINDNNGIKKSYSISLRKNIITLTHLYKAPGHIDRSSDNSSAPPAIEAKTDTLKKK